VGGNYAVALQVRPASPSPKAAAAAAGQQLGSRQQDTDLCELSDQMVQEPAQAQPQEQPAPAGSGITASTVASPACTDTAPSAELEAQAAERPVAIAAAEREGPLAGVAEVAEAVEEGQALAQQQPGEQQAPVVGAEASTLQLEDITVLGLGQGRQQDGQQGQEEGGLQEGGQGGNGGAAVEEAQGGAGLVEAVVRVVAEGEKAAAEGSGAAVVGELDLFELD
jgi:hypothetical protein